jgi:hypothetical protein
VRFDAASKAITFAGNHSRARPGVGEPPPALIPDVVKTEISRAKLADADGLHGALGFDHDGIPRLA